MFRRIPRKLAKEMLDTGLVYHDCKPYNVVRSNKGRWMYTVDSPENNWPRVLDWDSTGCTSSSAGYIYFLKLEA